MAMLQVRKEFCKVKTHLWAGWHFDSPVPTSGGSSGSRADGEGSPTPDSLGNKTWGSPHWRPSILVPHPHLYFWPQSPCVPWLHSHLIYSNVCLGKFGVSCPNNVNREGQSFCWGKSAFKDKIAFINSYCFLIFTWSYGFYIYLPCLHNWPMQ